MEVPPSQNPTDRVLPAWELGGTHPWISLISLHNGRGKNDGDSPFVCQLVSLDKRNMFCV